MGNVCKGGPKSEEPGANKKQKEMLENITT